MKIFFENINILRLDSALPWQPLAVTWKIHKFDDFSGIMCFTDMILVLKEAKQEDQANEIVLQDLQDN